MRLESMICRAMCGNVVGTGMELIRLQHLQTIQDLRAAPAACYGAGAMTLARTAWSLVTVATIIHISRTSTPASALRGPINILRFYLCIQLCWRDNII